MNALLVLLPVGDDDTLADEVTRPLDDPLEGALAVPDTLDEMHALALAPLALTLSTPLTVNAPLAVAAAPVALE